MFGYKISFVDGLSRIVRDDDEIALAAKRLAEIRAWHADKATEIENIGDIEEL